ncbi:MAG TPA: choice-of-anchor tandem repeat GloVer-containing protein, partial [Verrucomicrobiae bacterium]|nr:choice-of-anchor tandem repeat GloVer-containing protein [Verrucomicrobiae bacterium]
MKTSTSILIGTLYLFLAAIADAHAAKITALANFTFTNGSYPYGAMTVGSDGILYGTTYEGGTNNSGALFRLTTTGTFTPFDPFEPEVSDGTYVTNSSGGYPYAGLTLGGDGNLYGIGATGGTNASGTFFRVATNGALTPLFNFSRQLNNGNGALTNNTGGNPEGKLALSADGGFYGTTHSGGRFGRGAIFKVTTNGDFMPLVSFNGTNGGNPESGLTLGNDGNFYGATYYGGTNGNGAIFRVTTNGILTCLYSFSAGGVTASYTYTNADGANPAAALTLGSDGLFYGTCHDGGTNGYGTVFTVTTNGQVTTLVFFNKTNGASPLGELTRGNDGSFYGVTPGGGTNGTGTIFKIATNRTFSSLLSFSSRVSNGRSLTNNT